MPGTKLLALLALAIAVEFLGILVARYLAFSQFASVGIGLAPALLLIFPVIRHWYGGQLRFSVWLLTVAGITTAAVLIHISMR